MPAPLILAAGDEADFAGMLAHAMANAAQPQAQANRGNGPFGPFIWIGSETGFLTLSLQKPADAMAVQIMSTSGYDPEALVRYITRVQPFSMRIADLQRAIEQLSPIPLRMILPVFSRNFAATYHPRRGGRRRSSGRIDQLPYTAP